MQHNKLCSVPDGWIAPDDGYEQRVKIRDEEHLHTIDIDDMLLYKVPEEVFRKIMKILDMED